MTQRTPLYDEHLQLGGKLIDFGGWELPVQYSGVIEEHLNCRENAGLFDVSHMGEFEIKGEHAQNFVNYLITNDVSKLVDGKALYSVMCHPNGGIVDDLVVYRRKMNDFLLVVNGANVQKDWDHCMRVREEYRQMEPAEFEISNVSEQTALIAIQGPKAETILGELTSLPLNTLRFFECSDCQLLDSIDALVSRSGYTGEDGFEIYLPSKDATTVWRALVEKGEPHGLKPCGLGARDSLRLEYKLPLYGQDLTDETNPLEAALSWVVKLRKENFVGKPALVDLKENGISRKWVGFKVLGRGIPRHDYRLMHPTEDRPIGVVTSGTHSPSLESPIGIGYLETEFSEPGKKIRIEVRNRFIDAEVVETPFLTKKKR